MTEDQEQAEFVKWYARTYPHLLPALRFSMTAVTATLGSRKGAILKNRMKSLGVQFGEAGNLMDFLPVTSRMKKPQATEYIDTVMREYADRVRFAA